MEFKINASLHVIFLEFWVANSCVNLAKDVVNAEELKIFLFSLNGSLMLKKFLCSLLFIRDTSRYHSYLQRLIFKMYCYTLPFCI